MKKYLSIILMFLLCFSLASCQQESAPVVEPPTEEQPSANYIYEDRVILVTADAGEQSITFQNLETGLRYTLNYDGVTYFYDKYGSAMSAKQVRCGVIADITFDKSSKKLLSLNVSPDYFVYSDITFEEFIKNESRLMFLNEEYKLDDFLAISDGNMNLDKMELAKGDVITICGKDHTIYSIYLQSGHGYLRLENDEYFIGGWIEVGNKIIRSVSEDMLLTVPEGSYEVLVSNDGITGVKSVTIGRNQEVTLDLGDIDVEKKFGNVLFVLNPSDAELFVDGAKVDTGAPVSMEYGIHQLICRAEGYETTASYIKVGEPSASITLTLTKEADDDEDEDSSEEDSSESSSQSSESSSQSSENNSATSENNSSENSSQNSSESSSQTSSENHSDANGTSENSNQSSSENSTESNTDSSENSSQPSSENTGVTGNSGTASTTAKMYVDGPAGVEVYVDGSYVGIAPVSFTKPQSGVVITLRKTGYQTRSYTLQLDDNDKDVNYSFSELIEIGQ
ncbi:MAG: PEGA domain-containing protein [Lachnospiraceae bacterium]|nr:PEGA domain-containing protein [Lachnospiraceae bacterium]